MGRGQPGHWLFLLFLWLILALPARLSLAAHTLERLSLFAAQGSRVVLHTPVGAASNTLDFSPLGIQASLTPTSTPQNSQTWTWKLLHTHNQPLQGLRLTAFLDADIQTSENTFFNETAQTLGNSGAAHWIEPDRWEVAEPGYSRDVYIEFGNRSDQGGRMFGIGHAQGKTAAGGPQWFRQDWHGTKGHNAKICVLMILLARIIITVDTSNERPFIWIIIS